MYVRRFWTFMNPPMIVRVYKNKEISKFLFWVWKSRRVYVGIKQNNDENRASKFFKWSITISMMSSRGRKRIMPNFCQTFWIKSLKAAWFIIGNKPARMVHIRNKLILTGLSSGVKQANKCIVGPVFLFHKPNFPKVRYFNGILFVFSLVFLRCAH